MFWIQPKASQFPIKLVEILSLTLANEKDHINFIHIYKSLEEMCHLVPIFFYLDPKFLVNSILFERM